MEKPTTYCQAVSKMASDNLHFIYHNTAYGFPIENDDELFERLVLEINQAGLSWTTILNKQINFRKAFEGFQIAKVALYGHEDRERLLQDAGIIRNRLKIDATIHNASVILGLQESHGSFKNWLDHHHPKSKSEWVILFKKTFKFTGGEIVNEFLISTGYLEGAHHKDCKLYETVLLANPAWAKCK
ncbi:MAG: DNA-3-methyladenine glycosylase I [Saprospiraceae bacterium]